LNSNDRYLPIDGIVLSSLCILILVTQNKWKWPPVFKVEWLFLILALVWILSGNYLPAVLMLLFALIGFYSNRKPIFRFTKEGIYYPSVPEKVFTWDIVDFAMMKDGILTIELNDNRVFQYTLNKEVALLIDEAAFNKFCEDQCAHSRINAE
jgi:hypothetical protein